jgi:hypothetical protein
MTQAWVMGTGRRFEPHCNPWLEGPIGDPRRIGNDFFERLAERQGLRVREGSGLLQNAASLLPDDGSRALLNPQVARFYEFASRYRLDAWSEWNGAFRPFGWLLAVLFSRRLEQLNVPLNSLETSRGMTSRILNVENADGSLVNVAWIRTLKSTGRVIYCGVYSTCVVPGFDGTCLKVSFPLPNGNATVILWPRVESDGSLVLTSRGERFGDPGFYFVVHRRGRAYARYVRAMRERIRVYVDDRNDVRTDHELRLFGQVFLRLHYRMTSEE